MQDETIELLGIDNLKLIQSRSLFKYGTDAVLLSSFAKVKKGGSVLDLCTGTGIIPLLIYANNKTCSFDALEISEKAADMAKRSMQLNMLEDKIIITIGDVKEASQLYKGRQFDLVTCNPPYMNWGGGLVNPDNDKAIARHEILCTLEDIIKNAAHLTRPGGTFAMVHRPRRLADIMCLMREYKLEPKRLVLVSDTPDKEPDMILIEGLRGGGHYLKTYNMFLKKNTEDKI
ncbi:MAG: tRNA1(Val) (adenine(37)-N6)-methyltransferase [Bacillota bacterium]|nr:tRNA1(Val) (adenine(37)-N6)-methyltransferase [Bacillota bacterium]